MNEKIELQKIKEMYWLPLCITKSKINSFELSIFGVSVPRLTTISYRSRGYYKPISKILIPPNV